jgi:tetratricopeptide (TPR) repeat protein
VKLRIVALLLAWCSAAQARSMTHAPHGAAADHYRDGKMRYAAGNYAAALRDFEESWRLERVPAMWINIGQCLRALGRETEAVSAFERFLEGPGGNARLRGEVFEALEELRNRDVHPLPSVRDFSGAEHYYRGRLAYSAGDYERALTEFRGSYAQAPSPALLVNIGQALRKLDRPAEAISAYRTFLAQPAGSRRLRLDVFAALDETRRELDQRMYKLAESAAQFRRFLAAGRGTPEVRVVMGGTLKEILSTLVELDQVASSRYQITPVVALAKRP